MTSVTRLRKSAEPSRRPEPQPAYNPAMIRGLVLSVVLLATTLLSPVVVHAQQVDLSPRFAVDQPHRFRVVSESVVTRSIAELEDEQSQTTKLTYFLTRSVTEVTEERVVAQLRFDRILFATQAPNLLGELEDVVYDTGLLDPETGKVNGRAVLGRGEFVAQQYALVLDPLLGNAITLTLDRSGSILEVEMPEVMGDAEMFSVEMIRDRFLPLFQVHPDGDQIELGSEWQQKSEQDSGLGFDVVSATTWSLEDFVDELASIKVQNEFSTGTVRRDTGITLRESSGSGNVKWNTKLGVLESLTSAQAIRMAGIPKDLGGGPVELRVRCRLEIHRSPEPWVLTPKNENSAPEPEPDA